MSALHIRFGNPAVLPLDLLLSSIPSLPRAALDRLVDRAIDQMDALDPDPDLELNGDELDGTGGEDDFVDHYGPNMGGHHNGSRWDGAGCPISDPDTCLAGDDGCGRIIDGGRTIWGAPDPADQ